MYVYNGERRKAMTGVGVGGVSWAFANNRNCAVFFELDPSNSVVGTHYEGRGKDCWKLYKDHSPS